MARVRDLLDRFRPAGAPGGATGAGVPVDRVESLSAEVAPVFDELASVLAECERIRHDARVLASHQEAEAERRGRAGVAHARTQGEAERAASAAAVRARAVSESERTLARAREEAEAVRLRGERRRPQLAARAVELVRADVRAFAASRGAENGHGPGARP